MKLFKRKPKKHWKEYINLNICPIDSYCNYSKKCRDDDWKYCGVYIDFIEIVKKEMLNEKRI